MVSPSQSLIHCIYASLATPQLKEHEIPELLRRARESNARREITGMLLFIDGNFFQVLEGPAANVDLVYDSIRCDPRHTRVTRIIRESIRARAFEQWTMGFSNVDREDAGVLVGENDFFKSAHCIEALDGGRAKKLLQAFGRGRWRLERTGNFRALG